LSGLSISDYLKQNGTGLRLKKFALQKNYITRAVMKTAMPLVVYLTMCFLLFSPDGCSPLRSMRPITGRNTRFL
jgi:hypothetical protein